MLAVNLDPEHPFGIEMYELTRAWVDDCSVFDPSEIPISEFRPNPDSWWDCVEPSGEGLAVIPFTGDEPEWPFVMGFAACPPNSSESASGYDPDAAVHPAVVGIQRETPSDFVYEWRYGSLPGDEKRIYYEGDESIILQDTWLADDEASLELVVCVNRQPGETHRCDYGSRTGILQGVDLQITAYDARTGSPAGSQLIESTPSDSDCPAVLQFFGDEREKELGPYLPELDQVQAAIEQLLAPGA